MKHFIEIRSLNLKPGRREDFRRLYVEEALPLLKLAFRCGGTRLVPARKHGPGVAKNRLGRGWDPLGAN